MNFILSPDMTDDIIFAMENQNGLFFFDAEQGFCVEEDSADEAGAGEDESGIGNQRYYDIPEWTPAHGFRLMEQFALQVHNPLLREELRSVLEQRTGVFRRYKAVLKAHPMFERQWRRFKDAQMRKAVYKWYNELRSLWGLERLRFEEEVEDIESVLTMDFSFEVQQGKGVDGEFLRQFIRKNAGNFSGNDENGDVPIKSVLDTLQQSFLLSDTMLAEAAVITVRAEEDICALCLLTELPQKGCFSIPLLRVLPEYRGLGLGKALLQHICKIGEQKSAHAMFFTDIGIPGYFIPQLERNGFHKIGLCYVKE